MSSVNKNKLKIFLSVGLLISLGVNGYLYSQLISINQNISGVQTKLKNMQSEYGEISLKIEEGKSLLASQENIKIEKEELKVQTEKIEKQEQALNKQPETEKTTTPTKQTTPKPSTGGNSGGTVKPGNNPLDLNNNGIEDFLEGSEGTAGGWVEGNGDLGGLH